jgi:hypothetical protein
MITIRKAIPADAPSIVDFQLKMAWETEHLALDPETVTKGVKAVFAVPSRGQYYVADSSGKVVASLLITYEWSDWRNCTVGGFNQFMLYRSSAGRAYSGKCIRMSGNYLKTTMLPDSGSMLKQKMREHARPTRLWE